MKFSQLKTKNLKRIAKLMLKNALLFAAIVFVFFVTSCNHYLVIETNASFYEDTLKVVVTNRGNSHDTIINEVISAGGVLPYSYRKEYKTKEKYVNINFIINKSFVGIVDDYKLKLSKNNKIRIGYGDKNSYLKKFGLIADTALYNAVKKRTDYQTIFSLTIE